MAQGILVFIEQRNGRIRKASFEALSEAIRKAKAIGGEASAAILGDNAQALAADVVKYNPAKIYYVESAELKEYSTESYADALSEIIKKADPSLVLAANTALTRDLIPRVAARFDAPCISDAVEIAVNDNTVEVTKSIYSAKAFGKFSLNNAISFITLRPNVFAAEPASNGSQPAIESVEAPQFSPRAKVVETHASSGTKIELSEASIVVSGGRGIKGPENWGVLQSLCDVLGAALGASRAVVDAGWIDHQHQVGQTGKTVSPQLYIACGISGAMQHLAGMNSSKVIVAINKDADAPIFKHATYAVVGDVMEIVPKITEEVKRINEN